MEQKTILISLPMHELQALIIDSVNSCLKHQSREKEDYSPPSRKLNAQKGADYLEISLSTFYSKASKREIPVHKAPGSKRLFCFENELDEFIKQGHRKTNSEIEAEADKYLNKKKGLKHG